jgi:hypothetical protein
MNIVYMGIKIFFIPMPLPAGMLGYTMRNNPPQRVCKFYGKDMQTLRVGFANAMCRICKLYA